MSLIDSTYFQNGLLAIPNLRDEVLDKLNYYIPIYEKEYLNKLLGIKLKNQFLEGLEEEPIDDIWDRLLNGYEYDISNVTYSWDGFVTDNKKSPIANYIYCKLITDIQLFDTGIGSVKAETENGTVLSPQYVVSTVWNEMVSYNKELFRFLTEFNDDYEDWTYNYKEIKSFLNNDIFIAF